MLDLRVLDLKSGGLGSSPPPYHSLDLFSVAPSSTPWLRSVNYSGPKVSRQNQRGHGNFNLATAISTWPRQISIWPRQFQFQFAHGSFNLRQFQFAHGSFNLLTANSICSRQFQFARGSFNFNMTRCQRNY